uniref:G protein-coupled receptor n=1 Tax=Panagrellus redivivus TaxID=6233 RepID=A0A7E4WCW9_PANRE
METHSPPILHPIFVENISFYILITISILLGSFTYYVIATQSKTLGSFKYYIVYQTICAQIMDIINFTIKPIYLSPYLAGFSGGILRPVMTYELFRIFTCLSYCAAGTCAVSVTLAVVYRFFFMFRPSFKVLLENKFTFTFLTAVHLIAYAIFADITVLQRVPKEDLITLAQSTTGNALSSYYNEPGFYVLYNMEGASRRTYLIVVIVLGAISALLFGSIAYAIVFVFLNRKTQQIISKKAKSLLISSLSQAFLCVFFLCGPIMVVLSTMALDIGNSTNVANTAGTLLSFHGTLDMLSTLYFVMPYRKYCASLFGFEGCKKVKTWVTPSMGKLPDHRVLRLSLSRTMDPHPISNFLNSLNEVQRTSLETEVRIRFKEVSKFDDHFHPQPSYTVTEKIGVFADYADGFTLEQIIGRTRISKRTLFQIVADRLFQERFKCLEEVNFTKIFVELDLTAQIVADAAITIHRTKNADVKFLCSVNGLCFYPSQLVMILALLIVELEDVERAEKSLNPAFSVVQAVHDSQFHGADALNVFGSFLDDMEMDEDTFAEQQLKDLMNNLDATVAEGRKLTKVAGATTSKFQDLCTKVEVAYDKVPMPVNKAVDDIETLLTANFGTVKKISIPASGEYLYQLIYSAIKPGMDVYVNVVKGAVSQICYAKLNEIRDNGKTFRVRLARNDIESSNRLCLTDLNMEVTRARLAYGQINKDIEYPIGTRIIAYFVGRTQAEERTCQNSWLVGTIGSGLMEKDDYLVFFDNDQDAYIDRRLIRLHFDQVVIDPSEDEPQEVHRVDPRQNFKKAPQRAAFLEAYLLGDPSRMVHHVQMGDSLAAKTDRKTYQATVIGIDRELLLLRFRKTDRADGPDASGKGCTVKLCYQHKHVDEWVYRGSTTKLIAENVRSDRLNSRRNRIAEKNKAKAKDVDVDQHEATASSSNVPIARKSTAPAAFGPVAQRLVKNRSEFTALELKERKDRSKKIKRTYLPVPDWSLLLKGKRVDHEECGPRCLSAFEASVAENAPNVDTKVVSPFYKPIQMGWTRKIYTMKKNSIRTKYPREYVIYEAPCGMNFADEDAILTYLKRTKSPLTIFNFTFRQNMEPYVLATHFFKDSLKDVDFALGMEAIPIPVVNAVDIQAKPKMIYNTKRYPRDPVVRELIENTSPMALSCCSCKDDCSNSETCECQVLTFTEHGRLNNLLQAPSPLYDYGRVAYKVQSGIYECNAMCHCNKDKCLNYIAQRKISLPIQLFQTAQAGWGVRALVDIPKGTFVSTYAGEIKTDSMGDEGQNDMYYADLDLIDDFEQSKAQKGIDIPDEGYSDDMPVPKPSNDESIVLANYFGDDYIFLLDAFEEGNIGRFFNHSCEPNLFVQNVFADTHDLRLPWMAFFAAVDIKSGEELTWDYGYTDLSRNVACHCGADKCRGVLM